MIDEVTERTCGGLGCERGPDGVEKMRSLPPVLIPQAL